MVICIKKRGFTLIEVLVSLTILAIGLLGAATLIMHGLQTGQGASQRSVATVVLQSLADQIRANSKVAIEKNSYEHIFGIENGCFYDVNGEKLVGGAEPVCSVCSSSGSTDCTDEAKARRDLLSANDFINTNMPGGQYLIRRMTIDINRKDSNGNTVTTKNNNIFCLVLVWEEKGLGRNSSDNNKLLKGGEDRVPCDDKTGGGNHGILPDGMTSFYQMWVQL